MSSQILLSGGDKYYSYSGQVFGDVSAPATIPMVTIDNTGLRDSLIEVQAYFGRPIGLGVNDTLGILIKLDDVEIYRSQGSDYRPPAYNDQVRLFAPRNSKLEIISLNTSANNTQTRGVNLIGYYL